MPSLAHGTRALIAGILLALARPCMSAASVATSQEMLAPSQNFLNLPAGIQLSWSGARDPELDVKLLLEEALGSGLEERRLQDIRQSLRPTFDALPKNQDNRLGISGLRYLCRSFFVKNLGWQVKGLDLNTSAGFDDIRIVAERIPADKRKALDERLSRGVGLSGASVVVAALERLILDENVINLKAAYRLSGFSTKTHLTEEELWKVFHSYMVLLHLFWPQNGPKVTRQLLERADKLRQDFEWPLLKAFFKDVVGDFVREHLTSDRDYSFEDAKQILDTVLRQYGAFEDNECRTMKGALATSDPEGTGRVTLKEFYGHKVVRSWRFADAMDDLAKEGVIDETNNKTGPQVIIPNYVHAHFNCHIQALKYHSICCLDECEGLRHDLEARIRAPQAAPALILGMVANMSSSTVKAPRTLRPALVHALDQIAGLHQGQVPLHGRLFAQWLHYVFPHECTFPSLPHPHVSSHGPEFSVEAQLAKNDGAPAVSKDYLSQWTLDEEIFVSDRKPLRENEFDAAGMESWTLPRAGVAVISIVGLLGLAAQCRRSDQKPFVSI